MEILLSLIKILHQRLVLTRRDEVLSSKLVYFIPDRASVLDIGCGNGQIGLYLKQKNPSITIQGLEVLPRPNCLIECKKFDGLSIPLENSSADVCVLADVLHHTLYAKELLEEACRVSRKYVLIKDHLCENQLDFITLKIMDWIGNRPHGVKLVYNFLSHARWLEYFAFCRLTVVEWSQEIPLYLFPINKIVGRNLHFVALLQKDPMRGRGISDPS